MRGMARKIKKIKKKKQGGATLACCFFLVCLFALGSFRRYRLYVPLLGCTSDLVSFVNFAFFFVVVVVVCAVYTLAGALFLLVTAYFFFCLFVMEQRHSFAVWCTPNFFFFQVSPARTPAAPTHPPAMWLPRPTAGPNGDHAARALRRRAAPQKKKRLVARMGQLRTDEQKPARNRHDVSRRPAPRRRKEKKKQHQQEEPNKKPLGPQTY